MVNNLKEVQGDIEKRGVEGVAVVVEVKM